MKITIPFILFFVLALTQTPAHAASVLFMGDSHVVGTFGRTLDALLRTHFSDVTTLGSCGSIAKWWKNGTRTTCGYYFHRSQSPVENGLNFATPRINEELLVAKPDWVIVELGANYVPYQNESFTKKDVLELIEIIHSFHARCIFVGLPEGKVQKSERQKMSLFLEQILRGHCEYFDSIPWTPYPTDGGDGHHYETPEGRKIAKTWAKKVLEFILSRTSE